jgi:Tfp pilus assembly protein PilF/thiol-disulfide isomerase/thioredoxin
MGRRSFAAAVATFLALQLFQGVTCPPISAAFKRVVRGQNPPAFSAEDIEGREWKSSDLLGKKVTVVVFWATWSPRSREILADLDALADELGEESFQVVAINAEHENITDRDRASIREVVQEIGLSAVILLDRGLAAYSDYGVMALPSSLVVDERGIVTFDLAGWPTTMRSDLSDAVRKTLGLPTSVELRPPEQYKPKDGALMYYNFGRRLMEKGQEEKAEAQLLEAVRRDMDFVKPRLVLGIFFKKSGRLDEARAQFEKVKELDPANSEVGYQAAVVSLRAERFAEAEVLFGELWEEFPEREEFALGLALAHRYQGHAEEDGKVRALAVNLLAAEPRVHYEFGAVAESQGDLETAAALYRRAIAGVLNE